jgi:site-specific DNA recombinase
MPDANSVVTALLYTRVSTEDQAQHGLSLDAQLAECRQYALRQGWSIGGEYLDVLSGLKDQRHQYQALLQRARDLRAEGQRVAVVVAALDRFGRRVLERVRSREELKKLGVPTHSVREGGEVSDLIANILASVAEEETRRLGERVRATRQHLRAMGWKPPARVAFGYRWRKPTPEEKAAGAPSSVLEIDSETVDVVREMFQRVADGTSIRKTTAWLASLPASARGNRDLAVVVVSWLLRSPVYVARPDEGAADVLSRPVGRWPAIVSDDVWARVQRYLASHARFPHQITGRFLLVGYFRCPKCGNRITGHATKNFGTRYECRDTAHGEDVCRWAISTGTIDRPVLAEVGRLLAGVDRKTVAEAWKQIARPRTDTTKQLSALRREVTVAKDRLLRSTQLYVDGAIDAMSYELARDSAHETIAGAEAEITRLQAALSQPDLPDMSFVLGRLSDWAAVLEKASIPDKREVLVELVESVDVEYEGPSPGKRTGRYHVAVRWTPQAQMLGAV